MILYDLETTGLGKTQTLGITEIGTPLFLFFDFFEANLTVISLSFFSGAVACVYTNDLEWTIIDSYHSYVLPAQNISPDVPNGLTKQYLLKNNAKPFSRECGPEFKRFVEKHSSGKPALLCAHNGKRYDHRILCHHGWDHSGWAVDSLQLFKDASPGRNSYSLKNLHTEMFGTGVPAAHNAMPDVHAMLRVFNEMNVTPVLCVKHAESWECVRARVSKSES